MESHNLLRGYAEKNNAPYRRAVDVAKLIRNKTSNFFRNDDLYIYIITDRIYLLGKFDWINGLQHKLIKFAFMLTISLEFVKTKLIQTINKY
jgi:hypothetical protein